LLTIAVKFMPENTWLFSTAEAIHAVEREVQEALKGRDTTKASQLFMRVADVALKCRLVAPTAQEKSLRKVLDKTAREAGAQRKQDSVKSLEKIMKAILDAAKKLKWTPGSFMPEVPSPASPVHTETTPGDASTVKVLWPPQSTAPKNPPPAAAKKKEPSSPARKSGSAKSAKGMGWAETVRFAEKQNRWILGHMRRNPLIGFMFVLVNVSLFVVLLPDLMGFSEADMQRMFDEQAASDRARVHAMRGEEEAGEEDLLEADLLEEDPLDGAAGGVRDGAATGRGGGQYGGGDGAAHGAAGASGSKVHDRMVQRRLRWLEAHKSQLSTKQRAAIDGITYGSTDGASRALRTPLRSYTRFSYPQCSGNSLLLGMVEEPEGEGEPEGGEGGGRDAYGDASYRAASYPTRWPTRVGSPPSPAMTTVANGTAEYSTAEHGTADKGTADGQGLYNDGRYNDGRYSDGRGASLVAVPIVPPPTELAFPVCAVEDSLISFHTLNFSVPYDGLR
jgi:hypothetical protein